MIRDFARKSQARRVQRSLSAATALSALPLGFEIYFEHFRGSFGDRWMWTPIALSPLLSAAGVAGVRSERAASTVLPALSALYCLDGAIGLFIADGSVMPTQGSANPALTVMARSSRLAQRLAEKRVGAT